MSAFVSFVHEHGCHLFTDGAVWDPDQTLLDIRHKATVARSGHLAVTSIGDAGVGSAIARDICERADRLGVGAVMDSLQAYAVEVAHALGVIEGQRSVTVLVTAYVPGRGGVHRYFRSYAQGHACAYDVIDPGANTYWSGAEFTAADIGRHGLCRLPGEPDGAFVRRLGAGIIDVMRYRPGSILAPGSKDAWMVGGKIDCTSLLASGAVVETLKVYPDVIGERIDPYRGMPRAERRRMMRTAAH